MVVAIAGSRPRMRSLLSRSRATRSSEGGNTGGLLGNDTRVVELGRAGRLTPHDNLRARPHGQSRTAVAALLVAHDVPPLRAVDIAMAVGERRHVLVKVEIMPGADQMA